MNIPETRHKVNSLLGELDSVKRHYEEEKINLKKAEKELEYVKEAQVIAQQVAQMIQQQAHQKIEGVVNECLKAVFDDNYRFRIDFQRKRGKTEADLLLLKDGHEIGNAMDADSGGVVDLCSFALRLSCIALSKPHLRRIMLLDEPFRNLDVQNRMKIGTMLQQLSEDFKMQFILVTHESEFRTGKVIEI